MPFTAHPPPPGSEAGPAARGRILLVEDDPEAALFATPVLGERGRVGGTPPAHPPRAPRPEGGSPSSRTPQRRPSSPRWSSANAAGSRSPTPPTPPWLSCSPPPGP